MVLHGCFSVPTSLQVNTLWFPYHYLLCFCEAATASSILSRGYVSGLNEGVMEPAKVTTTQEAALVESLSRNIWKRHEEMEEAWVYYKQSLYHFLLLMIVGTVCESFHFTCL